MTYDKAIKIVRNCKNIYHAGLSCYMVIHGNLTEEENLAVDYLLENHAYELRERD